MTSQTLWEARKYEETQGDDRSGRHRQRLQIDYLCQNRSAFEPLHHGGDGGVQHGGLLERLVHGHDLSSFAQQGPAAAGAAEHPDQELGQREPGQHHLRGLRGAEQDDGDDQVLIHYHCGCPDAGNLSVRAEVF